MGAPTWPPDPRQAFALTAREYGVRPEAIGADVDEEERAERALLAPFLLQSPERQVVWGEENGLALSQVHRSLQALLTMLAGHPLPVAVSDPASTDGERVFLPRALPPPLLESDARLYRIMGLVQAGMVRFGVLSSRAILAEVYRDWVLRSCYHLLATRYVLRRWSAAYPGLARDVATLPSLDKARILRVNLTVVPAEGMPAAFLPLYDGLLPPSPMGGDGAGQPAWDALRAVDAAPPGAAAPLVLLGQARKLREAFRRARLGPPPLPYFAGILRPEWILADLDQDVASRDAWKQGPEPLKLLEKARGGKLKGLVKRVLSVAEGPPAASRGPTPAYGLLRDEHRSREMEARAPGQGDPWTDAPLPDADGAVYDEWDDLAGMYRAGHTRVLDPPAPAGPRESYGHILASRAREVREVRRRFEALRLEERWLHGQADGPEVDLDRVVRAACDAAAGHDPDPRVYQRFVRQHQAVAILVLVDLSGSTLGRVLHLEQDALVLLSEGLRVLDLPHGLYGFHNHGPRECLMERFKGFDEPYTEAVLQRLGNLRASGATRLGAFLRHAAAILDRQPQPRRLLLVLSDGRPQDRGDYQDERAIRDSALAVREAVQKRVHTTCVSLDPREDAPLYLERIFGRRRFLVLPDVEQLPSRLSEVVRAGIT